MRKGDKSLTPHIAFTGTKATIEAWASPVEGMEAITTDTHERGFYDGSAWVWDSPPTTTAASDFQVGDGSGNWIKKTLAQTATILQTALDSEYLKLSDMSAAEAATLIGGVASVADTLHTHSGISNGWVEVPDAWSYASASTITIPSGGASKYHPYYFIRWKQGGGYKYGVIKTVADTLLTVVVNTDFTVANSAITNVAYSTSPNPHGWPGSFNFATSPVGFTGTPTDASKISFAGRLCTISCNISGTSNATNFTLTLPITPAANFLGSCGGTDNGANVISWFSSSGATINLYTTLGGAGWQATGTKAVTKLSITFMT